MKSAPTFVAICLVSLVVFIGCNKQESNTKSTELEPEISKERTYPNITEVLTTAMEFQMPDTILSGWNTFVYKNASPEVHFMIFEKMPDGITLKEYKEDLIPPFKEGMKYALEGNMEMAQKAYAKFPEWWSKVTVGGGTGFISPDETAITSFNIDPGLYVVECYVRMADGTPHALMGMLKELIVIDKKSDVKEPSDTQITVKVSSENGIRLMDSIKVGKSRIKVEFEDQKTYENLLGHDLNLVKVNDHSIISELSGWLDATDPKALTTPSPKGVTFLGGVNDLPAGENGYFEVDLSPGNYALISEIPQAYKKGMVKVFIVN